MSPLLSPAENTRTGKKIASMQFNPKDYVASQDVLTAEA